MSTPPTICPNCGSKDPKVVYCSVCKRVKIEPPPSIARFASGLQLDDEDTPLDKDDHV